MTNEEKAKAYEMALEAARKELGVDRKEWEVVQRVLHNIFPELRESEDERMMKNIRLAILSVEDAFWRTHGLTAKEAISYLEKLKEQSKWPHVEPISEEEELCLMPQEQKPAEWSEEDEAMLNSVIRIITQFDDLAHEPTFAGPKWTHPYTKEIAWLKTHRPQPKQEVTDEEIEEMVTKRSRSSGTTKSEMAFYRNGIKDAIKRFDLRPSWKPSEE